MRAPDQALLPAARGTMVQHQTDSSADNVTLSVQSWLPEAGTSRRATAAAAEAPTHRVTDRGGLIYDFLTYL